MNETLSSESFPLRKTWLGVVALAAAAMALLFLKAPALALLLAVAALLFFGTLLHPDLASYAVLFLLYSNLGAVAVAFHGVPKLLSATFPLLLLVPLMRDLVVRRQSPVLTPVFALLALLLCVQIVSLLLSRDPWLSFDAVQTFLLEGVVLYVLVVNVVRTKRILKRATWALLGAGVLMSAVPLFQQVTGDFEHNYGGLAQVDGLGFRTGEEVDEGGSEERQPRLAGPIGEKNRYAQVMLVLLPLGLVCSWNERKRWLRGLALLCTASIALGFVLAFSRGGGFGLACAIAVMVLMRLVDVRRFAWIAGGVLLLFAAMPQYWTRMATVADSTHLFSEAQEVGESPDGAVKRRVTEMMAAVRVFVDHPVIGVGPGLFKSYAEEYGNQDALRRIEGGRRAHSLYLEIAAENGALGLTLFLGATFLALVGLAAARRACLASDPELANLATAYLLALVAYLASGVFLHLAYMRYFYLVLALGGAATHLARAVTREARVEPVTRAVTA